MQITKTTKIKNPIVLFLFFSTVLHAQIVDHYPKSQSPYIGGYEAYYKDFHDIIAENNLQPCKNKNEFYQFHVLITEDASIKFIKDPNEKYVAENKCAYDLAREVAKYQKGWNPAVVNGVKQNAIATFIIYPDDLFGHYKDGYYPAVTYPVFGDYKENHLEHFRKELISKLDLRRFRWNDIFTVEAEFTITKEGKMEDIVLTKKTGLEEFDRMIFYTYKSIRKKWKPATINGNPIDFRFKYVLRAITDPTD